MGFRTTLGGSPGRRLAGVLALAVLVAVSAQGAIGAPSDKKPRDARKAAGSQQSAVKQQAPAAADQKAVTTRSVGGVQVKIDPATGRLVQPSAEEAQRLAANLQYMLKHDAAELTPVQLPDGTVVIDLEDTFQETVMGSIKNGKVTLRCVNDGAQAARILAGEPIGDGAELSRVGAKRAAAANKGRAAAEKE